MFNLKKWLVSFLAIVWLMVPLYTLAQTGQKAETATEKVPVSIFHLETCGHCKDERTFLDGLAQERSDFEVFLYDVNQPEGRELFNQVTELEKLSKNTPITLIGNTIIQGFDTPETTGKRLVELIDSSKGKDTLKFEEFIAAGGSGNTEQVAEGTCDSSGLVPCEIKEKKHLVSVPFFGAVDVSKYSLPVLSAVLGFVDGFNPCAMWVLVTFLIILVDAGSRKKMWQLAGIFIVAEAIMYYLILNVWFTTWNFIGLNAIVTPIVGLVAVAAGLFFLYEWKTSDGTCKVTSGKQRAKTRSKLKKMVEADFTLFSLLGILGLAFSVNIIEFACSVGIPQTFTKIIELNGLSFWETQFYMAIYILMYMVDDLIVFGIALYSFEKIGLTTKYTKFSHLVGGILMVLLGLVLLIKPGLLVFSF